MKVVQINLSCSWGSTGKICDSISKLLASQGIENYVFYTYGDNPTSNQNFIKYSGFLYTKFQALKSRMLGNYGFNSAFVTRRLINQLEKIKPDIVHIHNIHGHDCHFEMLFNYLRLRNIKILYTFHDCWAFTGYCPHFTMANCDHWLTGCGECILRKRYSWLRDKSSSNCLRKQLALKNQDLTIITPSRWLGNLAKQSFLKEYPIKVINNGIDLGVFKPTSSEFRIKHGLEEKKIVLGVSFGWSALKGLDVFLEMARRLPAEYQIVLIGTDDSIDHQLPNSILSIHRTHDQYELAEIYSAADVFVNATREDTYPTVNMEAIACGTPVLTFRTGGSPEMLDNTCGAVVECDDVDALEKEIIRICTDRPYSEEACLNKAKQFDKDERFAEYVELYKNVCDTKVL